MSMRFPAQLKNSLSSRLQNSYAKNENAVEVSVPAQMKFQCEQVFIDHEGPDKHYLPVFHMRGYIKEITGDFPYGTTALYFDADDKQSLLKDIFYYPSPEELAHLITVGKFYSGDFVLPDFYKQEYQLPCEANMTIVPPSDEIAYEGSLSEEFGSLSEEQKLNLPIFYVSVKGTGISKERDKVLDYYGIELQDGFENFLLTAESSGYTEPSLMMYMKEPKHKERTEPERGGEYYMTAEEEAKLRREAMEREQQSGKELTEEIARGYAAEISPATRDDMLIAESKRNIDRRLEEKFGGTNISMQALRDADAQRRQAEENQKLTEPEQKQQIAENKMDFNPEGNDYVAENRTEKSNETGISEKDGFDIENKAGADVADAREQAKIDEAHTRDITRDAAFRQQEQSVSSNDDKLFNPDVPQQKFENKMDFNPEGNDYVDKQRNGDETGKKQSEIPKDSFDLENKAGADVSDAREQAKINDAHTRDIARDTAVSRQVREVKSAPESQPSDDDFEMD